MAVTSREKKRALPVALTLEPVALIRFDIMPRVTITVPERNAQPYRFQLDREFVALGRGSENDIAIDCGSVSIKHAEMWRVQGGYELRDMGSTNGIKLDDERYQMILLRDGMSIKLGDVVFDFHLAEDEMAELALEQQNAAAPTMYESVKSAPRLPPIRKREEPHRHVSLPMPVNKDIGGYTMTLIFILAAGAFYFGMATRFQKETGGSLIDSIKAKRQTLIDRANKLSEPAAVVSEEVPAVESDMASGTGDSPSPAPEETPATMPDTTTGTGETPAPDPAADPQPTAPTTTPDAGETPNTVPGGMPPGGMPGAVPGAGPGMGGPPGTPPGVPNAIPGT